MALEVNSLGQIWVFPKIRGTILGVPIIRIIVFWGLYWGPSFREITISFQTRWPLLRLSEGLTGDIKIFGQLGKFWSSANVMRFAVLHRALEIRHFGESLRYCQLKHYRRMEFLLGPTGNGDCTATSIKDTAR